MHLDPGILLGTSLAIVLTGCGVIAVALAVRGLRKAGRQLGELGDLDKPNFADWALDLGDPGETRCARCQLPRERALGLPCSCDTDCDADHCLAFANAEAVK